MTELVALASSLSLVVDTSLKTWSFCSTLLQSCYSTLYCCRYITDNVLLDMFGCSTVCGVYCPGIAVHYWSDASAVLCWHDTVQHKVMSSCTIVCCYDNTGQETGHLVIWLREQIVYVVESFRQVNVSDWFDCWRDLERIICTMCTMSAQLYTYMHENTCLHFRNVIFFNV